MAMALLFSDIETSETLRRLKETSFVFGQKYIPDASFLRTDIAILREYVLVLKGREYKRRTYNAISPELKCRRRMVRYIMTICARETFMNETAYLAIYLMDRFMDSHKIALEQLPVVATVCIVVAGKVTERRTPRYYKLAKYFRDDVLYSSPKKQMEVLVDMEFYILADFDFDVIVPTEANYLEVFLSFAMDGFKASKECDGDSDDAEINNNDSGLINANYTTERPADEIVKMYTFEELPGRETLKGIREMAYLILQEITISCPVSNYSPSLIAAAILIVARREHGLNFWTPNLQTVTTYALEEVRPCLTRYVEPNILKLGLTSCFTPPHFMDVVLETYITDVIDGDEDQNDQMESESDESDSSSGVSMDMDQEQRVSNLNTTEELFEI